MAVSGDHAPSYTHIAKFIREVEYHQAQDQSSIEQDMDAKRQAQIERIRKEAQAMREITAKTEQKRNAKGKPLKGNVTDNDSVKMATSKGVIQGYAAQTAVDQKHQVIVAAQVLGSGSEQAALIPMVDLSKPFAKDGTIYTADAGYHSEENLKALQETNTPAMIADSQMRKRDERFKEQGKHKAKGDRADEKGHRHAQGTASVQPEDRDGGAGVCKPEAQQGAWPLHAARSVQGKYPVEPVLPGAQHREDGAEHPLKWGGLPPAPWIA